MSSTHNPGRVAGLWYLLLCIVGPLRLIYIPSKLFVHGDAAATVNNIATHEWLFRFGIVGDLFGAVVLIFLVLAFYRLFKDVDQYLAMLVVVLGGVMPALLYFVNVVSDSGSLMIVRGADTARLELTPQSPGLLALSLGLSANFADDHAMLEHGMVMYDAFYAWCRSLQGETHNWTPAPSA